MISNDSSSRNSGGGGGGAGRVRINATTLTGSGAVVSPDLSEGPLVIVDLDAL